MFSPGVRGQIVAMVLVLVVACLSYRFVFPQPTPEGISLNVGDHMLHVRMADNPYELGNGLSGVPFLKENEGMLFILPEKRPVRFHMTGVKFPLGLALIDKQGVIVGTYEMPRGKGQEVEVPSEEAVFALEVRGGWFERHGINRGDKVRPEFSTLSKVDR